MYCTLFGHSQNTLIDGNGIVRDELRVNFVIGSSFGHCRSWVQNRDHRWRDKTRRWRYFDRSDRLGRFGWKIEICHLTFEHFVSCFTFQKSRLSPTCNRVEMGCIEIGKRFVCSFAWIWIGRCLLRSLLTDFWRIDGCRRRWRKRHVSKSRWRGGCKRYSRRWWCRAGRRCSREICVGKEWVNNWRGQNDAWHAAWNASVGFRGNRFADSANKIILWIWRISPNFLVLRNRRRNGWGGLDCSGRRQSSWSWRSVIGKVIDSLGQGCSDKSSGWSRWRRGS